MALNKFIFAYILLVLGIIPIGIYSQSDSGALLDVYNIPEMPYSMETDEDIINITSPSVSRQKVYVDLSGILKKGIKEVYKSMLSKNINWSGVFDYTDNPSSADYKIKVYDGLFSDYNVDFTTSKNEIILSDKLGYYPKKGWQTEYAIIDFLDKIIFKLTDIHSPLGGSILYTEKLTGTSSKYIVLNDTHSYFKKILVDNNKLNFYPRWSNSGDRFSFITLTKKGYTLRFYDLASGKITETNLYRSSMSGGSWSPDDSLLAVTMSNRGNADIYLVNTTTRKIKKKITGFSTIETSASYSHDGKNIILASNKSGYLQIYQYTESSPILQRLTFVGKYNSEPQYNPVNDYFLYGTIISGSMEIMIFNRDTSDVYRVTRDKASSEQAKWSPDGRQIIFTKKSNSNSNFKIHIMNMDGSYSRRLTYSDERILESDPDWSPYSIFRYIDKQSE